ncbi:Holliday junction branch migration protein RuvA, partial [bacterium]|nr:Holliday junction branch migration protein RuvA [bacterium]
LELSGRLVMAKDTSVSEEAVSALISLGYKRKEAEVAVRKALLFTGSKDLEEIIKKALSL